MNQITKIADIPLINIEHVLFDLDGTLISSYMDSPDRDFHTWQLLPGRLETLAQLRRFGISVSLITNQAGVAFGHITPGDVTTKLILVAQALGFAHMEIYDGGEMRYHGASRNTGGLLRAHVAYEHPKATAAKYRESDPILSRRKPSPRMLVEALFGLNPGRAVMVGDRVEDEAAAKNAGVRFVWADQFFGG